MCDTQTLVTDEAVWLAKNSDREPAEPQFVERHAPVRGDRSERLRCTHIAIPQVPARHGLILSRPSWLWGAEIGVNDQGVAIGNEAIFSRHATLEAGLLGMDLLRLGLERGATASEALEVITTLLSRYGQGGPAGYQDKSFHYDNSFVIADRTEAWVLETAGRDWAAKRVRSHYAISNGLTLTTDVEHFSHPGVVAEPGFGPRFDSRILPFFARSRERRELAMGCLAELAGRSAEPGFTDFFTHLRRHADNNEDPLAGSNRDLCLHACGPIRRSQTTGSMVARLSPDGIRVMLTGTSAPCLSLFRPASHDLTDLGIHDSQRWYRHERLHRRALFDGELRKRLRESRQLVETEILRVLEDGNWCSEALSEADRLADDWDAASQQLLDKNRRLRRPLSVAGLHWRRVQRLENHSKSGGT